MKNMKAAGVLIIISVIVLWWALVSFNRYIALIILFCGFVSGVYVIRLASERSQENKTQEKEMPRLTKLGDEVKVTYVSVDDPPTGDSSAYQGGPQNYADTRAEELAQIKLMKMKQMLDAGLITAEDYEEQKDALLLELRLARKGAALKCPCCGADMTVTEDKRLGKCDYCGTVMKL